MRNEFLPASEDIFQRFIKKGVCFLLDPAWNAISGFGNTARNCSNRIAVSAYRNSVSYSILKIRTFKKCSNRLWYGTPAANIKPIIRPDLVQSHGKIIPVFSLNRISAFDNYLLIHRQIQNLKEVLYNTLGVREMGRLFCDNTVCLGITIPFDQRERTLQAGNQDGIIKGRLALPHKAKTGNKK